MRYENILPKFCEDPLGIGEKETREYLYEIFEFHLSNSPYWAKISAGLKPDLDEIFQGSLVEVFEKILNSGLTVDEDYLRDNWLDFLPRNYEGRVRFYQSSGTTRERAIGHWDVSYVEVLHSYLRRAIDEIYGLDRVYTPEHRMRAIAHGPYGWYQDEISEFVWSYGGILYFIGMETDGLKRVLAEKGLEETLKLLDPLVKYTKRVMDKDHEVNTVRSAPPLMSIFEPYADQIETALISGVGIDPQFWEYISSTFENVTMIPLYGYYLFGDLPGLYDEDRFKYYPNHPMTVVFPVKMEDDWWGVVDYGERGVSAFIIARPEVLVAKLESETSIRERPLGPFRWDGFGEPVRGRG
jgi:hypothetical protein